VKSNDASRVGLARVIELSDASAGPCSPSSESETSLPQNANLHLCSAATTFCPLIMVFSQASTSKALPSTNGDYGFLDPSQALKHLSTYTSKDGLSLQELNDGRAGGITYNDFLCLVSTQLPILTRFECRIFSAWPYQFHC
jgi:hypothetical protein